MKASWEILQKKMPVLATCCNKGQGNLRFCLPQLGASVTKTLRCSSYQQSGFFFLDCQPFQRSQLERNVVWPLAGDGVYQHLIRP